MSEYPVPVPEPEPFDIQRKWPFDQINERFRQMEERQRAADRARVDALVAGHVREIKRLEREFGARWGAHE